MITISFQIKDDKHAYSANEEPPLIVDFKANHSDLENARFLNVARSFLAKVRKELEAADGDFTASAKRKRPAKDPNSIRTHNFARKVYGILGKNIRNSFKFIAKELNVSRQSIGRSVHKDLRCKSYMMQKGRFMFEKTDDKCQIRVKCLLS